MNRNNYRRVLGILYSFAVKQRYTLKNPVREVAIANVEVTKPGILTVPEARAMLDAATPDFLPVIALGLFAGLRPESEIWRLAWSNIDFEDRVIDVQKSKNVASHRFVRIPDNLLAWLKPYANKKGQVSIRNNAFFRRMRATRAGAVTALEERGIAADNLRDWPSDCLRHTFASCHYAAFKNAGDSAEQLGHGGYLTIFFRHYRGRIREPEAREYWEIYPRSPQPFSVVAA